MRFSINTKDAIWAAGAGSIAGTGSALLTKLGNPVDGGVSVACFCRDIAGSFGLHQTIEFSYLRPELSVIVLSAGITAAVKKQYLPTGGSSSLVRFLIGSILAFGVFAFIGCPMRTGLRLAGGDPSALAGLAGLVTGIGIGTVFLMKGFTLGTASRTTATGGMIIHILSVLLLLLLFIKPPFIILSNQRHAPLVASLAIGAIIGIAGQRNKLCFTGGFRDLFLIGDVTMLTGFVFLLLAALITNITLGQAHFGVHIIGSSDFLWSFLAVCVVGIASTFLGGCPFRQLILASQGNSDSTITLLGIATGAAVAYNLDFAFTAGSLDFNGKIIIGISIVALLLIGFFNREK
ncbi:MAG: YedE-related selenium metabolism membrane protein [Chitinispirillaceae bacterium]|nr:YedE-related selenium metabolism membrane protein [Chitinispirillaceae bacterium]